MLPPSFRETLLTTDYIDKRPTNTPGPGSIYMHTFIHIYVYSYTCLIHIYACVYS